jgi:hypothetical protein
MTRRLALILALAVVTVKPAWGLPTMIRLGYSDCITCHYAPQGGGPLNEYGKGIDQAQSLQGGEYKPSDRRLPRALSWDGRIAQDLRLVLPERWTWAAHESSDASFLPRLQYRNYTRLPRGFAAHVIVTGETDAVRRPDLSYDPPATTASAFVSVALLHFRVSKSIEIAGGLDQLPTAINVPDPRLFIKSRERAGYYDTPTQIKMYWASKRHRVTPFVFGPGGNEPNGDAEWGGGAVAEFDVLSNHRAVVGVSALRGNAEKGSRGMVGFHARLGYGPWGILAQHDITSREREDTPNAFRQQASYAQVFWAPREWLVISGIGERLSVHLPFEERLNAGGFDVTARLTPFSTIGAAARFQRDEIKHEWSKSFTVQFAFKTVY